MTDLLSSFQLGVHAGDNPGETQAEALSTQNEHQAVLTCSQDSSDFNNDHFITRDGKTFAGTHLIIDLWDAKDINSLEKIEAALRESVRVAKATLLHIHLHHFTPNGGVSGVAVLAESHISVHTWPERGYAAFDVFMCGDSCPELAIPVLEQAFKPTKVEVSEHYRGEVEFPPSGPL